MNYYVNENKDENGKKSSIIVFACIGTFIVALGIVVYMLISSYNSFVDARADVEKAQTDVETMMQRRLELIPDLVEVVKSYTKHEEKIFEDISNAENMLITAIADDENPNAISNANTNVSMKVNEMISIVKKDYPEIVSGPQYTSLMDQLEGSVTRIAVAREKYNDVVSIYNRKIEKAPGCILADMFGFERAEEFKADKEAERTNLVDMSFD